MRKLYRHKENIAAVFLAVCVLRALSGNGFTCDNLNVRPQAVKVNITFGKILLAEFRRTQMLSDR
jgi:hypothetical protein